MSAEPATQSRSRRALLAGALGGAVASALGRPTRADAADPVPVKLGRSNSASSVTQVVSGSSHAIKGKATGGSFSGLVGETTARTGFGVNGFNTGSGDNRVGVRGSAGGNGIGVLGFAARGVLGETRSPNGVGVVAKNSATTGSGDGLRALAFAPGASGAYAENSAPGGPGNGLHVRASTDTAALVENVSGSANAVGVKVDSPTKGVEATGGQFGVLGAADPNSPTAGTGVRGAAQLGDTGVSAFNIDGADGGVALEVFGGVTMSGPTGKATINSGSSSVSVTPTEAKVGPNSLVFATLQSSAGGNQAVSRVVVSGSSFTIHLTANATSNCTVAWFLVN